MPVLLLPSVKAKKAATRAKPVAAPKPKTGRPFYVPTKEGRQMVTVFRSVGLPIPEIAYQLKIDARTLFKYYREEMANGKSTIVSRIGGQVVKLALAGNLPAAIFYLKNHGGEAWKDKARLELTGPEGAPLQPPNLVLRLMPMPAPLTINDEPGT